MSWATPNALGLKKGREKSCLGIHKENVYQLHTLWTTLKWETFLNFCTRQAPSSNYMFLWQKISNKLLSANY